MARPLAHFGIDDPATGWPRGQRAVMLVPGEEVLALSIPMPARIKGRKADRIARNGAADSMAAPLGDLHISFVPSDRAECRQGLAIDARRLASLLDAAHDADLHPVAVLPDYLSLPWNDAGWTVKQAGERILARLGRYDGQSGEAAFVLACLQNRLSNPVLVPRSVTLYGNWPELRALCETHSIALKHHSVEPDPRFPPEDLAANLASGSFSETNTPRALVRRWRWPALSAALGLVACLTYGGLGALDANRRAASLDQQIGAMLRGDLGIQGPILDVRMQASRALAELRAAAGGNGTNQGFVALTGLASPVIGAHARTVSRVEFRKGSLFAEARFADFRALEAAQTALQDQGLSVRVVQSTALAGEGVEAQLAITRPGDGRQSP